MVCRYGVLREMQEECGGDDENLPAMTSVHFVKEEGVINHVLCIALDDAKGNNWIPTPEAQ